MAGRKVKKIGTFDVVRFEGRKQNGAKLANYDELKKAMGGDDLPVAVIQYQQGGTKVLTVVCFEVSKRGLEFDSSGDDTITGFLHKSLMRKLQVTLFEEE
ncbi:MAG TPA: hypothetical protein VFZ48_03965 [Candidatus Saccharimonadales bacterium]